MNKVSTHSGFPESVELRLMEEKHEKAMKKRQDQIETICSVLDKMPDRERRFILAEVIKHYGFGRN